MGFFNNFPYTNFHEMNLDWILKIVKETAAEQKQTSEELANFESYVDNRFSSFINELNIPVEVKETIVKMAESGELEQIIAGLEGLVSVYKTMSELKASETVVNGAFVRTCGYFSENDGGDGFYKIDSNSVGGISLNNGLFAHYIPQNNSFNLKSAGGLDDANNKGFGAGVFAWEQAEKFFANGLEIIAPAGQYVFVKPLNIGNGDSGYKFSSYNGIHVKGFGAAFDGSKPGESTEFVFGQFDGYALSVNGRISNVIIENVLFTLNGLVSGVQLKSVQNCKLDSVVISNPKEGGIALAVIGGSSPTGNYCINNSFNNVKCTCIKNGTKALFMHGVLSDGGVSVANDTWLTSFNTCRFEVFGENSQAGHIRFADNISFNRCHFANQGGRNTSAGLFLDSTDMIGGNKYPSGLAFYSCSISNVVELVPTGCSQGVNYFVGYGVDDGEVIPSYQNCPGITTHGVPFNGWGTTGGTVVQG